MIKVMIAGPYQTVRHRLKEILEQESDIRVTDEACSAEEVFERFRQRNCDVLILDKESAPETLVGAFRRASGGEKRHITSTLSESLASAPGVGYGNLPHARLSEREFQVVRLMASGKTVSAIAEEMCLSVKTISTYRTRIMDKMEMKTNAEVMRYAIINKLV